MKVLLVDDSKAMRQIVRRTLRQAGFGGHEFEEAENGVQALETLKNAKFDVVLCDWNMPEMNGPELLTQLKSENIDVKFGFVTSEGSPEMRAKASSLGAAFLIAKPFTADSFKHDLSSILG